MANNVSSRFVRWARDGILATIALIVIFATWVLFQVYADAVDRPSFLEQMLWTAFSGWLTNIAFVLARDKDKEDDD